MAASGKGRSRDAAARKRRQKDKEERLSLVLYRRPFITLHYFLLETVTNLKEWMSKLRERRGTVLLFLGGCSVISITSYTAYYTEGAHQTHVHYLAKRFHWSVYWLILGIMSSCGLGTGVHTFLLYLCPHIINVTLAAYECGSTDFPEPPYPEHVICPQIVGTESISVWSIMSKVRLEACMWGIGTAIGELPPYFMARAARLSGTDPEDEDYEEFEDMLEQDSAQDCVPRAKLWVKDMVQRLGFFGILAFASIPNPFFDLAGMTCGHYMVPFWTFFGATLIGKVCVKMHIQKLFVIMVFSKHIVEQLLSLIGSVPRIGPSLQKPLRQYLEAQKKKLRNEGGPEAVNGNWLQWVFGWVLLVTIFLIVCSIINSMAQTYAKRLQQQKQLKEKKKTKTKTK